MFPQQKNIRWLPNARVNDYYQKWSTKEYGHVMFPSPVVRDPKKCIEMFDALHREEGVNCSWGGFLEDRRHIWGGGYMHAAGAYTHLAVDFNVKAGKLVCVDRPCKVVLTDSDYRQGKTQDGGWGRRVIAKLRGLDVVLLYAHLAPGVSCSKNDELEPGRVIGRVGQPQHNGGWYPHVHVQAMSHDAWEYYRGHLSELDGYAAREQAEELKKKGWILDPTKYVTVP